MLAAATIDTSDYVFDAAYAKALAAGDDGMKSKIQQAYLDHTQKQIAYYAALNRQTLGYEPPAIMLLHFNRINADTLDAQLVLFRKAGYRFVSLGAGSRDPGGWESGGRAARMGRQIWCRQPYRAACRRFTRWMNLTGCICVILLGRQQFQIAQPRISWGS